MVREGEDRGQKDSQPPQQPPAKLPAVTVQRGTRANPKRALPGTPQPGDVERRK